MYSAPVTPVGLRRVRDRLSVTWPIREIEPKVILRDMTPDYTYREHGHHNGSCACCSAATHQNTQQHWPSCSHCQEAASQNSHDNYRDYFTWCVFYHHVQSSQSNVAILCWDYGNLITMTYLELVLKPRYGLARDDLVQFVHLHPQVASRDVCLSTGDQLLQSIMDEHILGLGLVWGKTYAAIPVSWL